MLLSHECYLRSTKDYIGSGEKSQGRVQNLITKLQTPINIVFANRNK